MRHQFISFFAGGVEAQRVVNILVNGKVETDMAKVLYYTKIVHDLKDSGPTILEMEKVFIFIQMAAK